jgi:hypothetical protein
MPGKRFGVFRLGESPEPGHRLAALANVLETAGPLTLEWAGASEGPPTLSGMKTDPQRDDAPVRNASPDEVMRTCPTAAGVWRSGSASCSARTSGFYLSCADYY